MYIIYAMERIKCSPGSVPQFKLMYVIHKLEGRTYSLALAQQFLRAKKLKLIQIYEGKGSPAAAAAAQQILQVEK